MPIKTVAGLFRKLESVSIPPISTVEIGGIPVELTRKRIRNIHLRVCPPDGHVRVSAPLRMSAGAIHAFVDSRLAWVGRHRQRMLERPQPMPPGYVDGESHFLWGQSYGLAVRESRAAANVELSEGRLVLAVRTGAGRRSRQAVFDRWYRARLMEALPALIEKWEPLTGVRAGRWSVRKMKSRWGSCNPRNGNIRLNSELAKKEPGCLEYVLVHELVHLLEASHNHRFKALMDRFMPDWRTWQGRLRDRTLD